MIGFDCAGKVQSQASCSNARCVQISNARFEWIGSRIAQRVSVVEIYYFDIGNAKRSCRGLFRWAYQIPTPPTLYGFVLDRQHLFAPRAQLQYLRWGSRHQHWWTNPWGVRIQTPNNLQLQYLQWSSYLQSTGVHHLIVSAPPPSTLSHECSKRSCPVA